MSNVVPVKVKVNATPAKTLVHATIHVKVPTKADLAKLSTHTAVSSKIPTTLVDKTTVVSKPSTKIVATKPDPAKQLLVVPNRNSAPSSTYQIDSQFASTILSLPSNLQASALHTIPSSQKAEVMKLIGNAHQAENMKKSSNATHNTKNTKSGTEAG